MWGWRAQFSYHSKSFQKHGRLWMNDNLFGSNTGFAEDWVEMRADGWILEWMPTIYWAEIFKPCNFSLYAELFSSIPYNHHKLVFGFTRSHHVPLRMPNPSYDIFDPPTSDGNHRISKMNSSKPNQSSKVPNKTTTNRTHARDGREALYVRRPKILEDDEIKKSTIDVRSPQGMCSRVPCRSIRSIEYIYRIAELSTDNLEVEILKDLQKQLPDPAVAFLNRLVEAHRSSTLLEIRGISLPFARFEDLTNENLISEVIIDPYINLLREVKQDRYSLIHASMNQSTHSISAKKKQTLHLPALMPLCRLSHWILAIIDPSDCTLTIFDSLRPRAAGYYRMHFLPGVYHHFSMQYELEISFWPITVKGLERQTDAISCGVFVAWKMKSLITSQPVLQFGVPRQERYKLMWELLFGLLKQYWYRYVNICSYITRKITNW